MLLAGIDASFDFDFNDYLHSASLCAVPPHCATLSDAQSPISFTFGAETFSPLPLLSCTPFPEIGCERTSQINKMSGSRGRVWHPESFDHIVRSAAQLERFEQYIRDNPKSLPPNMNADQS
jgi:hypothetical protein